MTEPSNWRDVKAKARGVDPTWDSAERVQRRAAMRREMLASVSGAQLADIRKQLGLTQAQLGGVSWISTAFDGPRCRLAASRKGPDGGGDISELLREAVPGPALGQAPAEIPMIVTGVRLPSAIVERLDALAGNDKASCLLRGKASPGGIPHFTDGRWW
jgi:hypothetical protein